MSKKVLIVGGVAGGASAKDPVNMAEYTAENILAGRTEVFVPQDINSRDPEKITLVDVRSEIEHHNGHIPGSILIPVDELRGRLNELDPHKEIWVYSQVGLRGYTASRILKQKGFKVRNLTGGYKTYKMANYTPSGNKAHLQASPITNNGREIAAALEQQDQVLHADVELDACGLSCPGPLIQVKQHETHWKVTRIVNYRITVGDGITTYRPKSIPR